MYDWFITCIVNLANIVYYIILLMFQNMEKARRTGKLGYCPRPWREPEPMVEI